MSTVYCNLMVSGFNNLNFFYNFKIKLIEPKSFARFIGLPNGCSNKKPSYNAYAISLSVLVLDYTLLLWWTKSR